MPGRGLVQLGLDRRTRRNGRIGPQSTDPPAGWWGYGVGIPQDAVIVFESIPYSWAPPAE